MGFDTGGFAGSSGGGGGSSATYTDLALFRSVLIDFTAVANYNLSTPAALDTGELFLPLSCGAIITELDGTLTSQPTLQFGETGDEDKYVAARAMISLNALNAYEDINVLLSSAGVLFSNLPRGGVAVGAVLNTATVCRGYLYQKGIIVP